jgi:hypothetical protein
MRTGVVVLLLGAILTGCGGATVLSVSSSLSSSTATATSRPTAGLTPIGPPPPPTSVKLTREGCYTGRFPDGVPSGECRTTITWKPSVLNVTEIRVYGLTECLSATEDAGSGSCLIEGTAIPASVLRLVATAPASDRSINWSAPAWQDLITDNAKGVAFQTFGVDRHDEDIYFAIVVAAYNEASHSKFIIADAGTWCYDTGCEGP